MNVLGIDVAKSDLHAALLQGDRSASKSVPNSQAGIAQLQTWLKNRKAERPHVCMEATGGWSEQVAISLSEAGHVVSIVNPARIKAFAQSEMVRTKRTALTRPSSLASAVFISQNPGRLPLRKSVFFKALCVASTA